MIKDEVVNQKSSVVTPSVVPVCEKPSDSNSVGLSVVHTSRNSQSVSHNKDFRHNSIYSNPADLFYYEYYEGGSAVKITKTKRDWARSQKQMDARRGCITTFSRKARQRLLWLCACLNQAMIRHTPKFVTLTYPSSVILQRVKNPDGSKRMVEVKVENIDKNTYKRHIKNFREHLLRKYPDCFVIARIELMDRKSGRAENEIVAHWHLSVFGVGYVCKDWVAKTWNKILTLGIDKEHLDAGTQVESAKDWRAVASYFSKTLAYVGKETESYVEEQMRKQNKWVGKHYAIWNRDELMEHVNRVVGALTADQFYKLNRCLMSLHKGLRKRRLFDDLEKLKVVQDGDTRGITNTLPDEIARKLPVNPKFNKLQNQVRQKQEQDERMKQFNKQMVGFKKWKRTRNFLGGSLMGFIPDELFVRMLIGVGKELGWDEEDQSHFFFVQEGSGGKGS